MDQEVKKDFKKFITEDTVQAFAAASTIFIILLIVNQIDLTAFTKLMSVNLMGFYGEKLTNFRGLN